MEGIGSICMKINYICFFPVDDFKRTITKFMQIISVDQKGKIYEIALNHEEVDEDFDDELAKIIATPYENLILYNNRYDGKTCIFDFIEKKIISKAFFDEEEFMSQFVKINDNKLDNNEVNYSNEKYLILKEIYLNNTLKI